MELGAHAVAVMALTALAFALFASDRLSIETVSFGVLVALTAGFQLFPYADVVLSLIHISEPTRH